MPGTLLDAATTSHLTVKPISYAPTVGKRVRHEQFGCIIEGIEDINNLTDNEFATVEALLYKHGVVVFPNQANLTTAGQHALTQRFDPQAIEYGHGKVGRPDNKSILHPDLRNIAGTPVQLIGNGLIDDPEILQGLPNPTQLRHPSHQTFHKTKVSDEDTARGQTRFYRWHMDAALYERDPPKVTTLCAKLAPQGKTNIVRYDDGTGDELEVPLGGTAFVSGKIMFDILPAPLKSLAVRTRVRYAPHPYIWMGPAQSRPTGLGLESEGNEMPLEDLPEWREELVKTLPLVWKNPHTLNLHLQCHPSGIQELVIDPLPEGVKATSETLYPNGAHLKDLQEVRDLVYSMQRPGIAPELVYVVDWKNNDLALFHNRGVLHSITGAFHPDEKRAFTQCNLASTDVPQGPSPADIAKYA
ncbi:TauD/TfdA family dioxygenase [Sporobolomyces koalae]|uniref:TauD/TfdA family dioxygenase n=1 Tax=Sporobolomyces koalae TaxID=500713 RepID=UPI00317C3608